MSETHFLNDLVLSVLMAHRRSVRGNTMMVSAVALVSRRPEVSTVELNVVGACLADEYITAFWHALDIPASIGSRAVLFSVLSLPPCVY